MGLLRILLFLGMTALTIQKSVKVMDIKDSPELEGILQNVLNQGLYKDIKVKINPNKKSTPKDGTELQYIGEISSEKEGKEGLKSLNRQLAKLLDGLQDSVMNENTINPECSCGYASKHLPGVLKCQCGSLSDDGDESSQAADRIKSSLRDELKDTPVKTKVNEIYKDRRKVRSVKNRQPEYKHVARFNRENSWSDDNRCGCRLSADDGDDGELNLKCNCNSPQELTRAGMDEDRDEGYWSDDNWCGCRLLRSTDDNKEHYLRCNCNSPTRVGEDVDRDEGYWSDDNLCGCRLVRSTDDYNDITHYVRCGCNSPARVGADDRDEGYWSDDNYCGCKLLRNKGNGVKDLRCRCTSPSRAGHEMYSAPSGYNQISDHYGAMLSDLSEEETIHLSKNHKSRSDDHNLNMLMRFILDKDQNVDLSHLTKQDRKVLIKLKDIMPSLRNVDINELKDNIESMLHENFPLQKNVYKKKKGQENTLTDEQIQKLLMVIDEQQQGDNKNDMYRRSMPEDAVGVPFTYEIEGLAQINV